MNGFVGVTDNDWFAFLSQQPGIDEVNFWQRSVNNLCCFLASKLCAKKSLECWTLVYAALEC